jgi:3'-5' exoribonuclease
MLASIEDSDYRAVAQALLEKHGEELRRIPAAKSVHHGFLGGLLMHTLNMLRLADFLARLYAPTVDRSLLLAGTFLHDLGKTRECAFSELGLVTDYSAEGQLLGHLVIGAQEAAETAAALGVPAEKSMLLQHLILSHHGDPEFGAAVVPQCAEGELLSLVDRIDSRMEIYRETLDELQPGEFSQRVFALEKRVYKHD